MTQASFLIKPASSLCNLRCRYCFYNDVSHNRKEEFMGIMPESVMKALIDRSMNLPVEELNYCFQGGEPTCAGMEFFEKFTDYVNRKNTENKKIHYSIQTNGTLIDAKWVSLFKKYDFLVGISIDGYAKNHNYFRKNANGKGTLKEILYNLRLLKNAGVAWNVLTVLTNDLAAKPSELYRFYKDNGFTYVQIIPCVPSLKHNEQTDVYALKPERFSSFYKKFFDLWFDDYKKGNYMSVTLFDNVIPMFRGILPQQCGMLGNCHMQLVVEGNGNVYPCDFYVLDKYCCGNVETESFEDIMHHHASQQFLEERKQMCKQCSTCCFWNMCRGNCRRLAECYYNESYCGYRDFLLYARDRMQIIASTIYE